MEGDYNALSTFNYDDIADDLEKMKETIKAIEKIIRSDEESTKSSKIVAGTYRKGKSKGTTPQGEISTIYSNQIFFSKIKYFTVIKRNGTNMKCCVI